MVQSLRTLGDFMALVETPSLAHCGRCQGIFVKLRSHVCLTCTSAEDADLLRIRDILALETSLNAEQLAKRAEVNVSCVLRMMKEGYIGSSDEGGVARCGHCGRPAVSARQRLCRSCIVKLDRRISEEMSEVRSRRVSPLRAASHRVHEILSGKRR